MNKDALKLAKEWLETSIRLKKRQAEYDIRDRGEWVTWREEFDVEDYDTIAQALLDAEAKLAIISGHDRSFLRVTIERNKAIAENERYEKHLLAIRAVGELSKGYFTQEAEIANAALKEPDDET